MASAQCVDSPLRPPSSDPRKYSAVLQFPVAEDSRSIDVRKQTCMVDIHPVQIPQAFIPNAIRSEDLSQNDSVRVCVVSTRDRP